MNFRNLKRFFLRMHLHYMLRGAHYCSDRWGEKGFLIIMAIAIGVMAAFAAAGLHLAVTYLSAFSANIRQLAASPSGAWALSLVFLLPLAGIGLSYLVQRYFGGPRYAKSLSPLILSLNRKKTNIPLSETITHMISSALSVGLGGSAGLEAPSVLTGSAIGGNTSSFFGVKRSRRSLLIGCGAAAAISAIFDSPIAGVLFAAEVLLPEFSVSALVPMLLSSAVSAVISHMLLGKAQFFLAINAPWQTNAIPCYFLCGVFCAAIGVYVIKGAYFISERLKKRFRNPWRRLLAGGSLLCLILFCFPALCGQGYWYIGKLFAGDNAALLTKSTILPELPSHPAVLLSLLFIVIFLKLIASVLTVDSGGDGGIFAPSMFIGAVAGYAFAKIINFTGLIELQEFNFVAVGMCGVFTAVMRAPLTGIFLIAEVTGGYMLLAPLMIVSSVAFFVARYLEPHSIYRKALAESNLLQDDRDQSMLQRLPVRLSINPKYTALRLNDHISAVITVVEEHNADETFPVLSDDGKLLGVVYLEKILSAMLNLEVYNHLLVFDLLETPLAIVGPDDDLSQAMELFDRYNLEVLPVCAENGEFLGFIEKTPIFNKYRNMVKEADSF